MSLMLTLQLEKVWTGLLVTGRLIRIRYDVLTAPS
jgi:hypothetical protein